jgi:hypothetical protein
MLVTIRKSIWFVLMIFQLRTTNWMFVHGNLHGFCRLENRTITFNICKSSPRLVVPVCVGYCPSSTRWEFRLGRFVARTSACTVTHHRMEQFVCRDATHTAIQLIIPLACSCSKHYCRSRNKTERHS